MPFVACKLPAGLKIDHNGETITLAGANIGENLRNPSDNGNPQDNVRRAFGFGLTQLNDRQTAAFQDWKGKMTFKNGKDGEKLTEPFPALENNSIMGPFNTEAEARKEVADLHTLVRTGTEGLDPEKEAGIDDAVDDGEKKPRVERNKK